MPSLAVIFIIHAIGGVGMVPVGWPGPSTCELAADCGVTVNVTGSPPLNIVNDQAVASRSQRHLPTCAALLCHSIVKVLLKSWRPRRW